MFCPNCGTQTNEGTFCSNCGKPLKPVESNASYQSQNFNAGYQQSYPEPGRGSAILTLGIISLVCLGPLTGIPAWVMGRKDKRKIQEGLIAPRELGNTNTGKILGTIGTFISPATLYIVGIFIVVGINLFQSSAVDANRTAVIIDLTNLASDAQKYFNTPVSLGGGGNTYTGYVIPSQLEMTANGTYYVTVAAQWVTFVGEGNKVGKDGSRNVKVTVVVTPTAANVVTINN